MTNSLEGERFELPARATVAHKLSAVVATKLREAVSPLPLTDGQKEFISNAGWFDVRGKAICPLPLLDADSFFVGFVAGHDLPEKDTATPSGVDHNNGNHTVTVHMFQDGSPFVYDDDLKTGTAEYTVLLGPDAPPTLVNQGYLEEAVYGASAGRSYGHGSWRDLSLVRQTVGKEVFHPLSDQDCENLLRGVEGTKVNIEEVVFGAGSIEGFKSL